MRTRLSTIAAALALLGWPALPLQAQVYKMRFRCYTTNGVDCNAGSSSTTSVPALSPSGSWGSVDGASIAVTLPDLVEDVVLSGPYTLTPPSSLTHRVRLEADVTVPAADADHPTGTAYFTLSSYDPSNRLYCKDVTRTMTVQAGAKTRVNATWSCTIAATYKTVVNTAVISARVSFAVESAAGRGAGIYPDIDGIYDVSAGPTVTEVIPAVVSNANPGSVTPPRHVRIKGKGFLPGATVKVGEDIVVTNVAVRSDTEIEADLDGLDGLVEGPRKVTVTNPSTEKGELPDGFYVSNLYIGPIEVNQGLPLQCSSSAPCIAGKETVVRVPISCIGPSCSANKGNTRARLHVRRREQTLDYVPIAGSPFLSTPLTVAVEPYVDPSTVFAFPEQLRRFNSADSFNFLFTTRLLEFGDYALTFEIDPVRPHLPPGTAGAPDAVRHLLKDRLASFQNLTPGFSDDLRIAVLTEGVKNSDVLPAFGFTRLAYPLTRDRIKAIPVKSTVGYAVDGFLWDDAGLFTTFNRLRTFLFYVSVFGFQTYDRIMFFTNSRALSFETRGATDAESDELFNFKVRYPISIVNMAEEVGLVPKTIAHELGHQFGYGDTYTGGAIFSSRNLPTGDPHCATGEGCDVEPGGMNLERQKVSTWPPPSRPPSNIKGLDRSTVLIDFMGNARTQNSWIDRRTWDGLFARFAGRGRPRPMADPGPRVWVSGGISNGGDVTFTDVIRYTGTEAGEDLTPGAYTLEARDGSGRVLSSAAFSLDTAIGHMTGDGGGGLFSRSLPFVSGTARLVVRKGASDLASRGVSASAPSVHVDFPDGGESLSGTIVIRWTASDADGDALSFTVFHSTDGVAWVPIAQDVRGTSFEWSTAGLGSSGSARVRVMANDGANTASDDSDRPFSLTGGGPLVQILRPADGAVFEAGQDVVFEGLAALVNEGEVPASALSFASSRDGALGTGSVVTKALSAGTHTVTLTARDAAGVSSTASVRVLVYARPTAPAEQASFVPIVLSTAGLNDSFFTSELTLTNRGSKDAVVALTYTPAFGGGTGGTAYDVLPAGEQRLVPDALAYLVARGVDLPADGNRGGTLSVGFHGGSDARAGSATVRTTTAVAGGRAGLSYPAIPPQLLTGPAYISGLRQTENDRSNVAVTNPGATSVTLRLTVFSGDPGSPVSKVLPDVTLAPGGFAQFSGILASNGLALTSGYVRVERIAGSGPYFAYGVINDQPTSDGSFVPPFAAGALSGRRGLSIPVVVETATFDSELSATNVTGAPKTVELAFVADAVGTADRTARFSLTLAAGEQRVLPGLVQFLRDQRVAGIGARGPTFAGALFATVATGDAEGLLLGVRTAAAARTGPGRFGLFYTGVPFGAAASTSAWVQGLQQNEETRSNLALLNTGDVDDSGSGYRIEIYDGDTGRLAKVLETSLPARRFTQLSGVLGNAPGVRNGYVKVTRTSGGNQFLTYGVLNDGGVPNVRTDDGAFVVMEREGQ